MEQLRIYIDKQISIEIEVTYATSVEEVYTRLNEKYKASPEDPTLMRHIFVAINKDTLSNRILRELRFEEAILKIHENLRQKRISHEFYALCPTISIEKPEQIIVQPKEHLSKVLKNSILLLF